ncbi:hypothetical protein EYF80_053696 [Liparis tanakae]|uniref:Uncharacterized protein n=1 Tax=Liparis tanakae TaxID=230148 RepID=A0A4Z2F5W4_9TELE|nr:hypothetical protein EYF80_053696 [Liparis tanakae]
MNQAVISGGDPLHIPMRPRMPPRPSQSREEEEEEEDEEDEGDEEEGNTGIRLTYNSRYNVASPDEEKLTLTQREKTRSLFLPCGVMPKGLFHSYKVRKSAVRCSVTKIPTHMDQWRGHMKAPIGAAVSRLRTWSGVRRKKKMI